MTKKIYKKIIFFCLMIILGGFSCTKQNNENNRLDYVITGPIKTKFNEPPRRGFSYSKGVVTLKDKKFQASIIETNDSYSNFIGLLITYPIPPNVGAGYMDVYVPFHNEIEFMEISVHQKDTAKNNYTCYVGPDGVIYKPVKGIEGSIVSHIVRMIVLMGGIELKGKNPPTEVIKLKEELLKFSDNFSQLVNTFSWATDDQSNENVR